MALSATALVTLIQARQHLRKDAASALQIFAEGVGIGDGANKTFTLDNTPLAGSLKLYVDSALQTETTHYSLSTATITFVTAPVLNKVVSAAYEYAPTADTFEAYDDDILEILINAATKKCEDYCKRAFVQRAITENRIGDGGRLLLLNKRPVSTFTSITMNATSLTEDTGFTLYKEEGLLERPVANPFWGDDLNAVGWTNGHKIVITYTAGYGATVAATQALVPEAVLAVLMMVSWLYENRLGLKSENISGIGSVDYGELGEIPEQAKRLLSSFNTNLGII